MYNYGYNNITYLGGEVKNPTRNIPRDRIFRFGCCRSIPTDERRDHRHYSVARSGGFACRGLRVHRKTYGSRAASVMTGLILTATWRHFSMTLVIRIPVRGRRRGELLQIVRPGSSQRAFHTACSHTALAIPPVGFPRTASLSVDDHSDRLPIHSADLRLAVRRYRQGIHLPFRMWLYPVPALIALFGWIYVAATPTSVSILKRTVALLLDWRCTCGPICLNGGRLKNHRAARHPSRGQRPPIEFLGTQCGCGRLGGQQESRTISCVARSDGVGMLGRPSIWSISMRAAIMPISRAG